MHMRSGPTNMFARRKRNRRVKIVRRLGGMHMRPELPINANIFYLRFNLELLFSFRDVDVGILQSIHFDIDVGDGTDLLLQQAQQMMNLILLVEGDQED